MSSRFKQFLGWFFENFVELGVIIASAIIFIQYNRGVVPREELLVWILLLLEGIAISGFIERNRKLQGIQDSTSQLQIVNIEQAHQLKTIQDAVSNLQTNTPGISHIYEDRTQFPSLFNDLANAKEEVFIVGLAMINLSTTFADPLKERAKQNCKLKILMLAPEINGQMNPIIPPFTMNLGFEVDTYYRDLKGTLEKFKRMRKELPANKRKFLEIRLYHCVPTFGIFAFDANGPSGKLRLDLIPYHRSRSSWPTIELVSDPRSRLYKQFYDSANEMWNDAEEVQ